MHVVQAESVGFELSDRRRENMAVFRLAPLSFWEHGLPRSIRQVGIHREGFVPIAEAESAGATGPAGKLPFRLRRQTQLERGPITGPHTLQPFAELPGVLPRNIDHRRSVRVGIEPVVLPTVFFVTAFELLLVFVPTVAAVRCFGFRDVARRFHEAAELSAADLEPSDVEIVGQCNPLFDFEVQSRWSFAVEVFLDHRVLFFRGRTDGERLSFGPYFDELELDAFA